MEETKKTGKLFCFGCRREIKEGENHSDPISCPYPPKDFPESNRPIGDAS